jgi:hypothetical protein
MITIGAPIPLANVHVLRYLSDESCRENVKRAIRNFRAAFSDYYWDVIDTAVETIELYQQHGTVFEAETEEENAAINFLENYTEDLWGICNAHNIPIYDLLFILDREVLQLICTLNEGAFAAYRLDEAMDKDD